MIKLFICWMSALGVRRRFLEATVQTLLLFLDVLCKVFAVSSCPLVVVVAALLVHSFLDPLAAFIAHSCHDSPWTCGSLRCTHRQVACMKNRQVHECLLTIPLAVLCERTPLSTSIEFITRTGVDVRPSSSRAARQVLCCATMASSCSFICSLW